ncbi:hypothetical protein [uncultured Nostoc sp.]|uniref:hypothetical protein n=1 Tax=uncultured Nostoc sp. TaxID=340711 RepID=UPI00260CA3DA|nr:hypothetical protein [uncultured Nostoc sp.]
MAILFLSWEIQAMPAAGYAYAHLAQNKLITYEQMSNNGVINLTLHESLINNFYIRQIWELLQTNSSQIHYINPLILYPILIIFSGYSMNIYY